MKNTKRSTLLPIVTPPITAYQQIALPLSVAMLSENARNWFYSNFIQVTCVNREHYIMRGNEDNALHYNFYCASITSFDVLDYLCLEGNEQLKIFDRLDFISRLIDEGWYIYTDADMYYIDGSNSFGWGHYTHDLLIYGYDEANIYIYMYDKYKLTRHLVSIGNFIKGYYSEYCNEKVFRNRAILCKPNYEHCHLNLEKIRWYIHDYLDGTETFARERPNIFNPDSLTMNGVNTYNEIYKLIDYAIRNEKKELRKSDLYCFYEHKSVMLDRVIYLKDNGNLSVSEKLLEAFVSVNREAKVLMFLGLKMNTLGDPEKKNIILMRMKDKIKVIEELERSAWNRYIDENKEILG